MNLISVMHFLAGDRPRDDIAKFFLETMINDQVQKGKS